MNKFLLGLLLLLVGLTACENDDNRDLPTDPEVKVEMVVVNEGPYGKALGALSAIYTDGSVVFDVFEKVNGRPLGDVAQSITYINGYYFVTLNNSKKIEVIDAKTFESVETIIYTQAGIPTFITPISDTEAIVSDLGNQLVRINTKTFKVIEYIPMNGNMGKMVTIGNKIFGNSGGKIKIIDIDNIQESGSRVLKVESTSNVYQTAKLLVDKNQQLWVFAAPASPFYVADQAGVYRINPETEEVNFGYEFPYIGKDSPDYVDGCITGVEFYPRMDMDRTKSKLYFNVMTLLGDDDRFPVIYSFDIVTKKFEPYRALPGTEKGMIYGMGISPDGDVLMCDCLDYSAQRGFLRQYNKDSQGEAAHNYQVGIFPRMVHFTEYDR